LKPRRVTGFVASDDGCRVWAINEDRNVLIFNVTPTGTHLVSKVTLPSHPVCIARDSTTPDSNAVYIGCADGNLLVCDLNSSTSGGLIDDVCLQKVSFNGPVVAICVTDSHVFVSSHSHGEIKIVEKMSGTGFLGVISHTWRAHSDKVKTILRAETASLWTCADDRFIKVWRLLHQGSAAWVMHAQDLPQQLRKIGRMILIDDSIISASDVITVWHKNGTAKKYLRNANPGSVFLDVARLSDSSFISAAEANYDRVQGLRDIILDVWVKDN
jgi:WD40 repeat protein